jgi:glutathione S-transferase
LKEAVEKKQPTKLSDETLTAVVYGGDHSPWVQAVLMGLSEKGIPWSLRSTPPIATFYKWGVLMPTLSLNGGPWQKESTAMLIALGFDALSDEDNAAIQGAWQGVVYRPQNPVRFLHSFAEAGDVSSSALTRSLRNMARGFIPFYMITLITIVRTLKKVTDPEDWGQQFLHWDEALACSDGPFIDGAAPGSRDLLLFGIVQCHSSIPVPPLEALRSDQRLGHLRAWIGRMQTRFATSGHLYSGQYFKPFIDPSAAASRLQQGLFYLGFTCVLLCLPITLPLVLFYVLRTPR